MFNKNEKIIQYDLKDIISIRTGLNPRNNFILNTDDSKIHYITVKNIKSNKLIFESADKVNETAKAIIEKRAKLDKNDILMASIGNVGDCYLLESKPENWTINESVFSIKPDTKIVNPRYLYHFFTAPTTLGFFSKSITGSIFKSIKIKDINNLKIKLPSIQEQQKIGSFLSAIDELITKKERSLKSLRAFFYEFKKNDFNFIVKRLVLINPDYKSHQKKVKEIVKYKNGLAHENFVDYDGNFVLINSKFISTNGQIYKKVSKSLITGKYGEIAIVLSDIPQGKALAKAYIIEERNKYSINQRIALLSPLNIEPNYLFYLIDRNPNLLKFDNGVSQTNLRKEDVLNLVLYIHDKYTQKFIGNLLDNLSKLLYLENRIIENLNLLKKSYLNIVFNRME
jgi:type I restriction enzyme S subunit